MRKSRIVLVCCLLPVGCAALDPSTPSASQDTESLVIVVGDATAADVVERLGGQGWSASSSLDQQRGSALVIIAQDSTTGPMPVHRDIVQQLLKRDERHYLWLLTNTAQIDDQELLELEELECRYILNAQGLPGDTIQFAFDSADAPVSATYACPKGWDAILEFVRQRVAASN